MNQFSDNFWKDTRVTITGGASFIGSHLVDKLVSLGSNVSVIDNLSSGKKENLSQSWEKIQFKKSDLEYITKSEIDTLFKDQEIVFHLAAIHGGRGFITKHPADVSSNFSIDHHVFEACMNTDVKNLVFASTACVYPTELQTTAGDKFAQIRGGGIINTKRLATGHFGNTAAYNAQQLGYIGDYMHYGCNAVYFLAQTTTGNSGYSSHMFSWYDSGHWGHYGKFVLMCQESSYIGGMAHRYLSGTTVTDIFSFGNAGSVSTTQTLTGSGTHSGQSVYRYDCTVSHTSTYRTMRWYLGLMHGCLSGVTGSGKTQSEVQTYANGNGSHLHLFGVSDSNLTMAPNYRTW